jgi:hypothetical protein
MELCALAILQGERLSIANIASKRDSVVFHEKQCPIERPILTAGAIIEIPELGGLHHRYERLAA